MSKIKRVSMIFLVIICMLFPANSVMARAGGGHGGSSGGGHSSGGGGSAHSTNTGDNQSDTPVGFILFFISIGAISVMGSSIVNYKRNNRNDLWECIM